MDIILNNSWSRSTTLLERLCLPLTKDILKYLVRPSEVEWHLLFEVEKNAEP